MESIFLHKVLHEEIFKKLFLHKVHQVYEVWSVIFLSMNILNQTVPWVLPLRKIWRENLKLVCKRVFISPHGNEKNNRKLVN